jgi:hypothetical protein
MVFQIGRTGAKRAVQSTAPPRDVAADPGVIPVAALVIAGNARSRCDRVINIAVLGATVVAVATIKAE